MSKLSLLDMVQDILSDMNDDEVSTISDTIESLQVAGMVKSTYYEMMANKNWPHLKKLSSLKQIGDSSKPTHMKIDDEVKELLFVEYDCGDTVDGSIIDYKEICWKAPDDFLRYTNQHNTTDVNTITVVDFSGVKFNIVDDKDPQYYTSFNDLHVVFDSYNSDVESTIQESKNRVLVVETPPWTMADSFIPNLPEEAFPLLLAEAKSVCFARIKQAPDAKSEQQAKRQHSWLSRKAFAVAGGIKLPNYGKNR